MSTLPEFVGTIHIFLGPYRGNPIALYLRQEGESCEISPTIYPWNRFKGVGETVNKAAANFDLKWKEGDLAPEMYSGPHWEGGIKPEKPKPPPKPAAPKPATTEPPKTEGATAESPKPAAAPAGEAKTETPAATQAEKPQAATPEPAQANPPSAASAPTAEASASPSDASLQPAPNSSPQETASPSTEKPAN